MEPVLLLIFVLLPRGRAMTEIPDHIREAFAKQTDINFAALGRYVQAFEQVCLQLRDMIVLTLTRTGLKDQQLGWIIVSHQVMTARPLLDIASAILREVYGTDKTGMKILTQLHKDFVAEIEHRNDWLHSSWFIGWGNLEEGHVSDLAHRIKLSPTKGLVTKTLQEEKDLEDRTDKLEEILFGFGRLFGCLHGRFGVEKNFWLIGGRYVSPDFAKKQGWKDERSEKSRS
jgi:hypothetical protein